MDLKLYPGTLSGSINVIPSKSQAHRLLICGAFADRQTALHCPDTNRDIEATAACLNALGADIRRTESGYTVKPITQLPDAALLPCRDSGSTLRFLLPVAGALGVDTKFLLEGRLAQRPLSPLWEEMERMGCRLSWLEENVLHCTGKLCSGEYCISGSVSSQFISGLLFAAALIDGDSSIQITGRIESKPYIDMTCQALKTFGCNVDSYAVSGGRTLRSPGELTVEGDWSNGAFFLAANALGSQLQIPNLSDSSIQGDRAVSELLPALNHHCTISAADIPDLVPILSVVAACNEGAVFTDIRRLRLKESDRVESVIAMISALGGYAEADENTLKISGTGLIGGTVNCMNDHRIAMAATIAATVCKKPVLLIGAQCVEKSYPGFFEEFGRTGGNYEQYLR